MGTPIAFASGTTDTYTTSLTKRGTVVLSPSSLLSSGVNFWNGVDVSSQYLLYSDKFSQGQSTIPNSRPTAWSTPSITNQNLTNLINTLPERVGQTLFSDFNVAYQWIQNSQKYILLNNGYEAIYSASQVLNLDAGWSNSYPTSGTTWTDLSGQANNGTLTNGPSFSTDGQGCILFDGTDDYVNCGNASSFNILRTVTMELWFKLNGFGSPWTNIFGKMNTEGDSSSRCYTAFINSSGFIHLVSADSSGQETVNSTNFISTGTWYHWVGVIDRNAGIMSQYVNGVLNVTGSVRTTDIVTNSDPVRVGYQGTTYNKFNGIVAVGRIYNTTLTAQQIMQNYNTLKSRFNFWGQSLYSGNTQYLDFSKGDSYSGSGTVLNDLSGNAYNASFNNGSYTVFDGVKCFNSTSSNSFLITNNVTLGNNYTIFCWSNVLAKSQVSNWRTLFRSDNASTGDHEIIVEYTSNNLGYYDNKNQTGFNSYGINLASANLENLWILYTIVGENGTTQKVYINDGTSNASVNKNATGQVLYAIGNYQGGTQQWGYVSNVVMYNNRAFTQAEVKRYYQSTKQYYGYDENNVNNRGIILNLDAANPLSYPYTGTTWFDGSGYGSNCTLVNGPVWSSSSQGLFDFDGADDYGTVTRTTLLSPTNGITQECWVNFDVVTEAQVFIGQQYGSGSNNSFALWLQSGGLYGGVNVGGTFDYFNASWSPSTGVWYHAAYTWNGSTQKLFLNGSEINSRSTSGTLTYDSNNTLITIGGDFNSGYNSGIAALVDGKIGAVRIYNRGLSNAEILANFNAQKSRFGL